MYEEECDGVVRAVGDKGREVSYGEAQLDCGWVAAGTVYFI